MAMRKNEHIDGKVFQDSLSDWIQCGRNLAFPRNTQTAGPNDNVMVIGGSGRGKTSGFGDSNLMKGGSGSIIVSDPKGGLADRYSDYFASLGYEVLRVDFLDPEMSVGYNPFLYLSTEADIQTLAHTIVYPGETAGSYDPFWDISTQSLVHFAIAYMLYCYRPEDWNFTTIMEIIQTASIDPRSRVGFTDQEVEERQRRYEAFRRNIDQAPRSGMTRSLKRRFDVYRDTPGKTKDTILATSYAKLSTFDVDGIAEITSSRKAALDFRRIAEVPTILFVSTSDMDRSNDVMASIFFTQCFQELCKVADQQPNRRLPVNTRILMDDFASSVVIRDFPSYTSTIRSRGLAAYVCLQSLSQLTSIYGEAARTILDNFDTQIYFGGNDVGTARAISERCNLPLYDVLTLPYGESLVMRTGQPARRVENYGPYEAFQMMMEKDKGKTEA